MESALTSKLSTKTQTTGCQILSSVDNITYEGIKSYKMFIIHPQTDPLENKRKKENTYLSNVVGRGVDVVTEPGEEGAGDGVGAFALLGGRRHRLGQVHALLPVDLRRFRRRLGHRRVHVLT